ncbi:MULTISPECIES: heavy metal translocating P-type ATPase [Actinomycetes]|nr:MULTISPECIES: cation-translocating P-type ATPase [Actinomycetes]EZP49138.1 Heavy metal translocating P-type ATPase [Micrococcus luteus]MBM7231324.1 cadmium-translocating P-type ATPase [Dietzia cinnamea]MCT1886989.1 cadmium-translocating P-type ATPase [Dietzia cinnamea]MCT2263880.1 cadmium-translocating P-type ATPase [Dietzia cinnamea]MCT2275679.1 cadmium-translocating P-type ATPase [Dietzia cinnamea]
MVTLAVAAVLLVAGLVVEWTIHSEPVALALFWGAILIGGVYPLRSAIRAVRHKRLTITVLLVVAAIGAIALGVIEEAAMLVVIFSLGEAMEAYATDKARGSISALMELAPPTANRLNDDGATKTVAVEELHPGDVVLVRPGERLPTDGAVIDGASWVDASPVTGESVPVEATAGTEVFGGSLNGNGVLRIEVTKEYYDTVLARVIEQVEEAQANRSGAERFADKFGAVYTPAMFALAIAVALVLPLLGFEWREAIYRALVVLVVSCSCALIISVPVSVVTAIARGARDGILIKGGIYLERLADIKAVAFDKTGTLTRGRPTLAQVTPLDGISEDEALTLAAAVETGSEHPIATAIVAGARDRGLTIPAVQDARALPGAGMEATLDGRTLHIGRPTDEDRTDGTAGPALAHAEAEGCTAVVLRDDTRPLAVVAVADQLRPDAESTLTELRDLGVERVLMLTGDNATVARSTAQALGLDDYRAELLPEDKSAAIRELREKHGVIAMVGDGVNDAPALANADLAIAMGAASTDVALETADVALMADELDRLPAAIRLSRRARNNIKINIALSLTVVAILIVAALAGWMSLTTGLLLNEGSAALIILNGLRMLRPGRGETRRAQVDFGTRQGSDLNSGRPCAPGSTTDGHSVAAGSSYDQREHGR